MRDGVNKEEEEEGWGIVVTGICEARREEREKKKRIGFVKWEEKEGIKRREKGEGVAYLDCSSPVAEEETKKKGRGWGGWL